MLVVIDYQGYSYSLEVPNDLNHSELTDQLWWILKKQPQMEMTFEQLYYQSQIWRGHKYQQMEYPAQVLETLR